MEGSDQWVLPGNTWREVSSEFYHVCIGSGNDLELEFSGEWPNSFYLSVCLLV